MGRRVAAGVRVVCNVRREPACAAAAPLHGRGLDVVRSHLAHHTQRLRPPLRTRRHRGRGLWRARQQCSRAAKVSVKSTTPPPSAALSVGSHCNMHARTTGGNKALQRKYSLCLSSIEKRQCEVVRNGAEMDFLNAISRGAGGPAGGGSVSAVSVAATPQLRIPRGGAVSSSASGPPASAPSSTPSNSSTTGRRPCELPCGDRHRVWRTKAQVHEGGERGHIQGDAAGFGR